MQLEKSDFNEIKYNFFVDEEESVFNLFPELGRFPEFKLDFKNKLYEKWREEIIKMIMICYDPHSPLVKHEKDIIRRKVQAFDFIGVKKEKDGTFPTEINQIVMGRSYEVQRMTAQFLKLQNNFKWSRLCALVDAYYQMIAQATTNTDEEGRKDRFDTLEKIGKYENEIRALEDEVTMQDYNLANIISEMEMESEGKITDYPIHIARLKKQGKWPPLSVNTKSTTSKKK